MIIRIFNLNGEWHYGDAAKNPCPPAPESRGYKSKALATMAAVRNTTSQGQQVQGVTGMADRATARELGVKLIDPRKPKERTSPQKLARNKLKILWHKTKTGQVQTFEEFESWLHKIAEES